MVRNIEKLIVVFVVLLALWQASFTFAQINMNVELLSHVDFAPEASDIWGYVDDLGREYAIIGTSTGTRFYDITNPTTPVLVGTISGPNSIWRDIKTYSHYAYVVEDQVSSNQALQIIDLSNLPNSVSLAANYSATFTHAHNLYIDETRGFAYVVGGDVANGVGGISKLNLTIPTVPMQVATYASNYVHDVYVRNDTAYASAVFSGRLQILKVNPTSFSLVTQFNTVPHNFTHNAWTTEDGAFVATTDEVTGGTLKVWDIRNLANIELADAYSANASAIIHNVHIKGQYAFVSHYTEGLQIIDLSDPFNITRVGYYDTYPGPSSGFNGAWGVYPYLPSGNVIVSDIQSGLWVFGLTGPFVSRVTARVNCPATVLSGCTAAAGVAIDMTETSPQQALGSYQATMTWNPQVLQYAGFTGGEAPFNNPIVDESNVASGELAFSESDAAGLGGVVDVMQVQFNVVGNAGASGNVNVSFSQLRAAGTLNNLLPVTAVENCSFSVEQTCRLGDVTLENEITIFDALVIASFAVDLPIPPEFFQQISKGCGDVSQEGNTSVFDSLLIASYAIHLPVDPFPVGEPLCP